MKGGNNMQNEFMTIETLTTFTGLVASVSIIVQFTKSIIKRNFNDGAVRIYAFLIALCLTFIFARTDQGLKGFLTTLINAVLITMTSMGAYEGISDPLARKTRR